jgi:hypothetical protein
MSKRKKKGRPQTSGAFYSNGRRKQPTTQEGRDDAARVHPTAETARYVQQRLEYWLVPGIWNLAAAEHCYDNAGVLWATGWFDNHGFTAEEIREVFREYACLYWRWYGALAPKISKGERADRSEPSNKAEGWELRFQKLDSRLKLGSTERRAVHQLAVNDWYFDQMHPDAIALCNLGRITIGERKKVKLPIVGEVAFATGDARDWLDAALRGAFQMLDARAIDREIPLWKMGRAA